MTSAPHLEHPVASPPPTKHDITLSVPRQWSTRRRPAPDVVLVSRARTVPASGFRPEIVVRTDLVEGAIDDGLDGASDRAAAHGRAAWRTAQLAGLARHYQCVEIEDEDEFELNGRPVDFWRFAHLAGPIDVICEQWSWLVEGLGITMTCSVARGDYLDHCDLFDQVAETVEISLAPRACP